MGSAYRTFDGTCWPVPCERLNDIEHALRYGTPTIEDRLVAASIVAAYRELVTCGRRKREGVVAKLKAAGAAKGRER